MVPQVQFRIGAIHHLAALVLWTKDFCSMLARQMHSKDSLKDGSCWIFLLDQECRNHLIELLLFVIVYHHQLKNIKESRDCTMQEVLYLMQLESILHLRQIQIEAFVSLLFQLSMQPINTTPEQIARAQMHLLCTSTVDPLYSPLLEQARVLFEGVQPSLFAVEKDATGSDSNSFLQPPRSYSNNIDCVLKTRIRPMVAVSKCSQCNNHTQAMPTIDPGLDKFQNHPSWKNSQGTCSCGGKWELIASTDRSSSS